MLKNFGTITPSSNVMVERVTLAMTRDIPAVSPHFARFGFAGSSDRFQDDYDWDSMLGAAALLADARQDVICWNGSKGGLVGFEKDRLLCRRIEEQLSIAATTSTLALDELLQGANAERIAFVTPYRQALNDRIRDVWTAEGYRCVAAEGAGLADNFSYSTVSAEALSAMARSVREANPQAIVFYCSNTNGAEICAALEAELGCLVLDVVSAGVWKSLSVLGVDLPAPERWGSLLGK